MAPDVAGDVVPQDQTGMTPQEAVEIPREELEHNARQFVEDDDSDLPDIPEPKTTVEKTGGPELEQDELHL